MASTKGVRFSEYILTAEERAARCIHYVGFCDDRYRNAFRVFGGPRIIHRRWDRRALREIGPEDVVVFAQGDDSQPFAEQIGDDIDERWF